jgi:hypothetical protein
MKACATGYALTCATTLTLQLVALCDETETKYPNSTSFARKSLLSFPLSYLVECGFSAVNDLLLKKINCLDITNYGDLRLQLTK